MTKPIVSVHMLTYNQAPYIAQAIEGVLMQKTDFPFELVIGEDCSIDGTREIVLQYAQLHPDHIRVIMSEQNVGTTINDLRTLRACNGKYIAWCEGDDYWHRDDKLQMQVQYLECHPDCGLVHSDYDFYNIRTGNIITSYNRHRGKIPPHDHNIHELLSGVWGIRTCTAVGRVKLVNKIHESDPEMYTSGRFLLGDLPFWTDIASLTKIYYFDQSLAVYRVLPESVSHSESPFKQYRFYQSTEEMRVYMAKKHGFSSNEIYSYEQKLASCSLVLAFLNQDKQTGRSEWLKLSKHTLSYRMLFWGSQTTTLNRILRKIFSWKFKFSKFLYNRKWNINHVTLKLTEKCILNNRFFRKKTT